MTNYATSKYTIEYDLEDGTTITEETVTLSLARCYARNGKLNGIAIMNGIVYDNVINARIYNKKGKRLLTKV